MRCRVNCSPAARCSAPSATISLSGNLRVAREMNAHEVAIPFCSITTGYDFGVNVAYYFCRLHVACPDRLVCRLTLPVN